MTHKSDKIYQDLDTRTYTSVIHFGANDFSQFYSTLYMTVITSWIKCYDAKRGSNIAKIVYNNAKWFFLATWPLLELQVDGLRSQSSSQIPGLDLTTWTKPVLYALYDCGLKTSPVNEGVFDLAVVQPQLFRIRN